MGKGILLDENDDLKILVKRDVNGMIISGICTGETKIQDACIVLKINQGELKEDPIIGSNLLRNIRMKRNDLKIRDDIRKGFKRANINFDEVKHEIIALINKQEVEL